MIGIWTGILADGSKKVIEEGKPFGPFGGIIKAMAPVSGANVIRVCVEVTEEGDTQGDLQMGKIMEENFVLTHYQKNGKGYNDYSMPVRERMKFFTNQEKQERAKARRQQFSNQKVSQNVAKSEPASEPSGW